MSTTNENKHSFAELFNELAVRAERIALLEAALRFYADETNYVNVPIGYALMTRAEMDGGERARKALAGDISGEAKEMLR